MKVLFIIPAYNEAENIEATLKDIKENIDADIVVIDDCSKDSTRHIVSKLNVECISLIHNVGYAKAIQTGLKYATLHDYDYIIQFDADGQHLASEAKKLLSKAVETNSDIVIGSRFLMETNYPHSFFRKMGTALFVKMIAILGQRDITDPTSGFQCLNRRTFNHYSKLGNFPEYPDANLLLEMIYRKCKIEEISVKMKTREFGVSMHSGIIKPIKYMILMVFNVLIIWINRNKFVKDGIQ